MLALKPPILTGDQGRDLAALRDWAWQLSRSLESVTGTGTGGTAAAARYGGSGQQTASDGAVSEADKAAILKSANELKALIIKSAENLSDAIQAGDYGVISYADQKVNQYNSMYVAKSEYGNFVESITTTIEDTARGVVESYDYDSAIQGMQDGIETIQSYFESINGEIRRGIVQDPETGSYVTGIAIAQSLSISGTCGPNDSRNPGDGYTYYYLTSGQTFGLYTSTGWQFWIDGFKKGWFSSADGMLHVANVYVENSLILGGRWSFVPGTYSAEIRYIGYSDADWEEVEEPVEWEPVEEEIIP